jgi:hypothetical protein
MEKFEGIEKIEKQLPRFTKNVKELIQTYI